MNSLFYLLDILVALAILGVALGLRVIGRLPAQLWQVFLFGTLLGLAWELPFYLLGPDFQADPLFVLVQPWPLPTLFLPLLHAVWDGGIFLVGALLVSLLCPEPTFACFRWRELLVLIIWGISSALAVEVVGSWGGWAYVPRWWNPALFAAGGAPVTLLPVIVWAVAPVLLHAAMVLLAHAQRPAPKVAI